MKIVILTNDNFFSFTVLKEFFQARRQDIRLVVFSSALIGKKGMLASVKWSLANTGLPHTVFKLTVYGTFRLMNLVCGLLPFLQNRHSSRLAVERMGIQSIDAADVNASDVVEQIRTAQPDLIVSVSMNQIVKQPILQMPPKGCINVHCAPLPRYGGMSPYVWALANGEDHSAATIHYMEEGLDTGDIIVQEKVAVMENDSAFALFYRCCLRAAALLPEVVDTIENGTVQSHKQDLSQKTYYSWPTRKCVADLHKNGYRLARLTDFTSAIFKRKPRVG